MKKIAFQRTKTSKLAANELRHINLNGSEVPYTLMRCRRKTIGMRVSSEGLTVRIPMRESLSWVESVLQKRADWIVTKLDEWKNRKPTRPAWEEGAIFPLLGEPWQVTVTAAGAVQMMQASENARSKDEQPGLSLSAGVAAEQIESAVMKWYRQHALTCFTERIALYANKLGVALPQLRLSSARTLWGSCNSRGIIRLNWRLVQKPLDLVDYVVAHELSHLIEMNHSKAFWETVGSVYPGYATARKRLKEIG
ncbi:M48 family metallopeptidase [Nitrosospira multiformis]|nr:SprT family zinc-dependent metalloprotease [Nitrosospira multiformis]